MAGVNAPQGDVESGKLDEQVTTEESPLLAKESDGEQKEAAPQTATTKKKKKQEPGGGFTTGCHMFFVTFSALAIVILLCMALAQIILLCKKKVPFLQFSLRLYILLFCLLFVLVELEWPASIMRNLPTQNWLMRGWLYSFLGLVGMEQAFAYLVEDSAASTNMMLKDLTSLFIQIASWGMVVVGVLYFAMGVLCMRSLSEKVRNDYVAAKGRIADDE